jgi:hypothetical protein
VLQRLGAEGVEFNSDHADPERRIRPGSYAMDENYN